MTCTANAQQMLSTSPSLQISPQKGNTLLELLLGLAVMVLISISVIEMNNKAQSQEKGRLRADALQGFTQVVTQYFIANRGDLESAMSGSLDVSAAHSICAINLTAQNPLGVASVNSSKHTCAVDTTLLSAKGLWPQSMPINQGAQRLVAVFRLLSAVGTANPTDDVLILSAELEAGLIKAQGEVVYAAPKSEFVEQTAATLGLLGASGGYVPPGEDFGSCHYNPQLKEVCGQGWRVNLADFL